MVASNKIATAPLAPNSLSEKCSVSNLQEKKPIESLYDPCTYNITTTAFALDSIYKLPPKAIFKIKKPEESIMFVVNNMVFTATAAVLTAPRGFPLSSSSSSSSSSNSH